MSSSSRRHVGGLQLQNRPASLSRRTPRGEHAAVELAGETAEQPEVGAGGALSTDPRTP